MSLKNREIKQGPHRKTWQRKESKKKKRKKEMNFVATLTKGILYRIDVLVYIIIKLTSKGR